MVLAADCACVPVCSVLVQVYQVLGTVVHAAMSADSSCRGLRTPRDGPILLELTKGTNITGSCQTNLHRSTVRVEQLLFFLITPSEKMDLF